MFQSVKGNAIGLVVPDVCNPFFIDVAHDAELAAAENGFRRHVVQPRPTPESEGRYLDLLEEQRVQGVLITPVGADYSRLELLAARGTPVVLVDRGSDRANWCSVAVYDVLGDGWPQAI